MSGITLTTNTWSPESHMQNINDSYKENSVVSSVHLQTDGQFVKKNNNSNNLQHCNINNEINKSVYGTPQTSRDSQFQVPKEIVPAALNGKLIYGNAKPIGAGTPHRYQDQLALTPKKIASPGANQNIQYLSYYDEGNEQKTYFGQNIESINQHKDLNSRIDNYTFTPTPSHVGMYPRDNLYIYQEKETNDVVDLVTLSQMIVSFAGLMSGVMSVTLGIFHLCATKAFLSWPQHFLKDANAISWRKNLFTFSPETAIDVWTPCVFGIISCVAHFKSSKVTTLSIITRNYLLFAVWNFVQAFWANLGYRGGLGICIGIFSLLVCAGSLIVAFIGGDTDASLNIDYGEFVKAKDSCTPSASANMIEKTQFDRKNAVV